MELYKWLGISAIVTIWLGLLLLIQIWPRQNSMTLSQHAAQTKGGRIYYFSLFLITLPALILFFVRWFIPQFDLPFSFTLIITAAIIAQAIAALVPEVGTNIAAHRAAALGSALLMIPMVFLIGLSTEVPYPVRVSAFGVVLCQFVILAIIFKAKAKHPCTLYLQITYLLGSHLVIIGAALW